jgi:Cytosol aminopeptidase family, N-terminal domain
VEISLLPLDLARWDQSPGGDLFALLIGSDVRPLRGAAGLVDWRFNGRLSACLRENRFQGHCGEKLLMPTTRLCWRAVLAVGVGPSRGFDETRLRTDLALVATTARRLGQRRLAIAVPGRELSRMAPGRVLALMRETFAIGDDFATLILVDTAAALKTLADLLGVERQRALAGS